MRNRTATPSERLESFDLTQLDSFETYIYNDMTSKGIDKITALQVIISNCEGDTSQLSEELKDIAELTTETL